MNVQVSYILCMFKCQKKLCCSLNLFWIDKCRIAGDSICVKVSVTWFIYIHFGCLNGVIAGAGVCGGMSVLWYASIQFICLCIVHHVVGIINNGNSIQSSTNILSINMVDKGTRFS